MPNFNLKFLHCVAKAYEQVLEEKQIDAGGDTSIYQQVVRLALCNQSPQRRALSSSMPLPASSSSSSFPPMRNMRSSFPHVGSVHARSSAWQGSSEDAPLLLTDLMTENAFGRITDAPAEGDGTRAIWYHSAITLQQRQAARLMAEYFGRWKIATQKALFESER